MALNLTNEKAKNEELGYMPPPLCVAVAVVETKSTAAVAVV